VLELLRQALTEITPTKWRSAAERIKNVILDAWEQEGLEEVQLEKLISLWGQEGDITDVSSSHDPPAAQEVPGTSSDYRDLEGGGGGRT
jgi:hypothetical protein